MHVDPRIERIWDYKSRKWKKVDGAMVCGPVSKGYTDTGLSSYSPGFLDWFKKLFD